MLNAMDNDTIIHLIQLSVAPVFLLAGVAGLLNVFTGRLTRIIDKLEKIDAYVTSQQKKNKHYKEDQKIIKRREFLLMRMKNTNYAIFFCASTGFMVGLMILSVFATTLFDFHAEYAISILFILAMVSLCLSLFLFLREIYYTTYFIRMKKTHFE